jgi:REP element-mobilizing transposase RayT
MVTNLLSLQMKTPELTIYRRKLPHWRMLGAVYFVTWRLAKEQPPLRPEERTLAMDDIKHFDNQRYELAAYVVMNDHVHVLVFPLDEYPLHRIVHSWKSFSAKRIAENSERRTPIWQREYFDRIVRDEEELIQKAKYILGNPFRRWPDLQEYQWVGIGSCF